jgi:hypothetical protein
VISETVGIASTSEDFLIPLKPTTNKSQKLMLKSTRENSRSRGAIQITADGDGHRR